MSDTNEKKDGSCCKTSSSNCCGSKKLFVGIVLGVLIAAIAHCFLCGSGTCGKPKMCPFPQTMQQGPAQ